MKAEHRKELETNALADRVGRVVQGMKQAPQKRTLLYLFLLGAVLVVVFLFYRRGQVQQAENSQRWVEFDDGAGPYLNELIEKYPNSYQGKTADYERTYAILRQKLRSLATNPTATFQELDMLEQKYAELAKENKDDKVLYPEALFAQAVIEETRIVKDDDNWKKALAAYKEVAENHKDSACAKMAQKRVDVLENKEKRDNLLNIYRDIRIEFVREDRVPNFPPLPPNHPVVPGIPKPDAPKPDAPK